MIASFYEFLFFVTSVVPRAYVLLMAFSTMIPGVYIASRKNFLYTLNQKYDFFVTRLFFTVPGLAFLNFGVSVFIEIIVYFISPDLAYIFFNTFGYLSILLIPLIFDFILILYFRKISPTDKPEILRRKECKCELYVYIPSYKIHGGNYYGAKFEIINKSRKSDELMIQNQISDLIIREKELHGKNISLTDFGELILTKIGLDIFNENAISGFDFRPVMNSIGNTLFPKAEISNQTVQLISNHIMPPLSSKTIFRREKNPASVFVSYSDFYYCRNVLDEICDLNQTVEYFGSNSGIPYFVQRYWIITKKTKDILIHKFDQKEEDFRPVYLVEEVTV
ncbi:hypothetical protein [Methanolapillus millepedarum]|uniref:Uncharacterized protein n=1 Tax=Methanolapillus millepedarum TaxID=3028296 RepID=A0AA97A4I4_9EURY|nr:hypothetical protein MsAc7_14170 [Methanosarcinaceae archaeon Ac7]